MSSPCGGELDGLAFRLPRAPAVSNKRLHDVTITPCPKNLFSTSCVTIEARLVINGVGPHTDNGHSRHQQRRPTSIDGVGLPTRQLGHLNLYRACEQTRDELQTAHDDSGLASFAFQPML